MYSKATRKLIRFKLGEPRPSPFWTSSIITNNSLFVRNMGNGGRLGNKLFELAGVFGVAKLNSRTPILEDSALSNINWYFNTRVVISKLNEKDSNFLTLMEPKCDTLINETRNLPPKNVTIGRYLLSRLYFEEVEDELRQELMFKPEVLESAKKFLNGFNKSVNESSLTRVVIHVRRGDLFKERLSYSGFIDLGLNYFSRSMDYFNQCYDRVQFVVLSDDIAWCKKNILGPDVIYSEGLSPGADLALSSLCDHAIITYGTYSAWVSWFADGITIRPRNNAIANSRADEQYKSETEGYFSDTVLL